jgi:hypothetical protein
MPGDFDGKSRLADASRAGQRDEPMLVYETDHCSDLVVPADQIGCLRRKVGPAPQRIWNFWSRFPAAGRAGRPNIARELVTAANDGPNDVIARESLAQGPYLGVKVVVLDDPARPDPIHQRIFADDGAIRLKQRHKHVERTTAEL